MNLPELFGPIDIYLFDQLLKGRFEPGSRILDAGCGGGRNLTWFLRNGFDVWGTDRSAEAIKYVSMLAEEIAPALPRENFRVAEIAEMPFADAWFDAVISSAVLHFADDEDHFNRMIREMWRVLKPGGLFFARLASTIGIEERVEPIEGRWYNLPDGSKRFLVDEEMLVKIAERIGGRQLDPIKTTIVQNMRSMTTWVLRKGND